MLERFISTEEPFVQILGVSHLMYLAFCIITTVLFIKNYRWVRKNSEILRRVFFGLLAFQQVFLLYGWYFFATDVFLSEGLPLHMCRVASALTLVFLITKSTVALDVLSYFSIFALISLFYPLEVYNFTHISGFSYMINHIITVLIPIFAVIAFNWYPCWRSYRRAVIGFTIYFAVALAANYFTGGNYFYQTSRPFLHDMSTFMFGALSYAVPVAGFAILTYVAILGRKLYTNFAAKRTGR